MKKVFILVVMVVVALGLSMLFYAVPVEVKAPVQKDVWNRAGSGFELTSVRTGLPTSVQKEAWNRYGSGFELTSVRTADEIKVSIQKYMWNQADGEFESLDHAK